MGYDRDAPKRAVSFELNEDLVRHASQLTGDLTGTLEALLDEFVARHASKPAPDAQAFKRFVDDWAAYHEKYGLLSDEFPTL